MSYKQAFQRSHERAVEAWRTEPDSTYERDVLAEWLAAVAADGAQTRTDGLDTGQTSGAEAEANRARGGL